MKKSIFTIATLFVATFANAQNIIVQQNNSTIKQDPPVVYKEKVVYVEKKQQGPILVAGYLWVYPERLGSFTTYPSAIINGINKKRAYGKNTWRIPSMDEYIMLETSNNIQIEKYGVVKAEGMPYYQAWVSFDDGKPIDNGRSNVLILVSGE